MLLSKELSCNHPLAFPGTCVTQDMPDSEGLWLEQTLPFKILHQHYLSLSCSPRLLASSPQLYPVEYLSSLT